MSMEHLNLLVSRASEVREETVSTYSGSNIERYVVSFNSLIVDKANLFLTDDAIWSGALFECSIQSEASYFMMAHGLYEEASALLRMLLEGFLTRMYWHIRKRKGEIQNYIEDGELTNDYAKWAHGSKDFPPLKEIWGTVINYRA